MTRCCFDSCPLCGEPIAAGDHTFEDEHGFFSLSCCCGCNFSPGVTSIQELAYRWNSRFVTDQMIHMVADLESSTPQENKTSFLRSGKFFFWLSCVLFALMAYFSPSAADYPSGLSGVFSIFGFYCLFYGLFRYFSTPDK
ncbi:MAG: hypothetical protein D3914_00725 [Candidatus Electrothrix sp. LOE2]|nr:hypothetical protein [Candidatus Electrothrix sp. LOE2]